MRYMLIQDDTNPEIQMYYVMEDDINQLIETLKNSSNSTTITEQSLPTEKKYIFHKEIVFNPVLGYKFIIKYSTIMLFYH